MDHERIDAFYVELTATSVSHAVVAMKMVAGFWSLGPSSAAPRIRRRKRIFRFASRVAKRGTATAGPKKTAGPGSKPKVSKKNLKKSKPAIEPTASNYSRSSRGYQLIRQQLESLHELDKVFHPKKPAFSPTGECRLQPLELRC